MPAFAQTSDNFSGFKATALVGFDRVNLQADGESEGRSGFAYGGALGYDRDLGRVVVGAEAEIMGATTKYREAGVNGTLKAGRDLYVGARLGGYMGENVLFYVKGGYTNARATIEGTVSGITASVSDNLDGWRIGAGADIALPGKLYGRLEYRYSAYNNIKFQGIATDLDMKRHQVLAGVGYRF